MNKFSIVKEYVEGVMEQINESPLIVPGPDLPDVANDFIVCGAYGGPGLTVDGAIDEVSWQFRVVGKQNNYDQAETMAQALDMNLISHYSSYVGGVWVTHIRRVGGAPSPLLRDDAERTHFVCSYVAGVELALPN